MKFAHRRPGLVELRSFPIPGDVYVARKGLAPEVIRAFQRAMISLKNRRARKLLVCLQTPPIEGFAKVNDTTYDKFRSLTNWVEKFERGLPTPLDEK
jgi:ABC-type phosphate/phosphonate transport system substrate-binding protein